MSTPLVPPRPQRTQAGHTAVKNESPLVPPRPFRKTDPSPDRENFARSPLNGPPTAMATKQVRPRTSQDLPRRPPSVSLPDIGREGDEYSSFDVLPPEAHGVSTDTAQETAGLSEQTKNVSADLPMYQPKASLPQSSAKKQIENVTGTDSTQAAAAGIGRARPADDVHKMPPSDVGNSSPLHRVTSATNETRRPPSTEATLRAKASFNRSTPNLHPIERTTSRPASIHGDDREHGIPEIGVQVPLLHMAGDVQMPHGASRNSQFAPGIGFFNDGTGRAHHRKRSSRHEFGLPDVYGLHHDNPDQFEKEWIRKHPQEAAKEGYYMHLPKPQTALTSEQLNRLVHQNDQAAAEASGTPDEHIADEYISRVISAPQTPALGERTKRASSGSHPSSPFQKSSTQNRLHPDDALEFDDGMPSSRRASRMIDDEHEHEHADGTPILAADELLKRPGSAYMHAAVERDPDSYYDEYYDSDTGRRNSAQPTSRPSSRPSSIHGAAGVQGYHGGSLHRFVSHEEQHHSGMGTPLEEIEEYEPLFPEDEKDSPKKAFKKRPELAQHHFPSRDIWEDTPASLQYSATVSTPDLERAQEAIETAQGASTSTFETPEQEQNRRTQNDLQNNMTADSKTFVKPQFKAGVVEEMHRPGPHRFPSSDIWEDSPDSAQFVTTVGSPDLEESAARPAVPSRPQRKSKLTEEAKPPEGNEETAPASPEKSKAPGIPAKPSIPARPVRASNQAGSAEAETVKAKPPVPARPAGEKISALKAGFMNDLNNRLKLGPQGPPPKKEPEPEVEEEQKAPLVDARKTRARGPPRRRQAATSPAADRKSSASFAFSPLINCWSIDEADELQVHEAEEAKAKEAATAEEAPDTEKLLAENEQENVEAAAPAANIASQIVNADKPGEMATRHRESESDIKAALFEAGVAPASFAKETGEETVEKAEEEDTKDEGVQTGETKMTTTEPTGEQEEMTAFVDAKAQEGNVVVKDGNDVQS